MRLPELQKAFMSGLFAESEDVINVIKNKPTLSPSALLSVYRGSMLGIKTEAMNAVYPVCKQLVGEPFFDALSRKYLSKYTPKTGSLDDLGEGFPDFCRSFPALNELPYFSDVAALEWAWHRAFHARNDVDFDAQAFAELEEHQWNTVRLQVTHSVQFIRADYSVMDLWSAHQSEPVDEFSIVQADYRYLVHRVEHEVVIESVNESTFDCLQWIAQGVSLAELFSSQHASTCSEGLPNWLAQRLIVSFTTGDENA